MGAGPCFGKWVSLVAPPPHLQGSLVRIDVYWLDRVQPLPGPTPSPPLTSPACSSSLGDRDKVKEDKGRGSQDGEGCQEAPVSGTPVCGAVTSPELSWREGELVPSLC